jgi:Mg2+ and Co2+ transporter CorA
MTELMKFSAFSISQFLNLVERQIVPIPDAHVIRSGKHDTSYLSYHEQMLEDLITTLRDNIRTIRARGGQGWPSLKEGPGTEQTAKSANALLLDFSELLRRAEILAKKCRSNMIMTMTQASIAESQRAIAQAVRVEQLTRLASFFLPLSFSASLLGMNMELFGQGTIPVWVWFAISVPIGGLTFLMLKLMSLRATG